VEDLVEGGGELAVAIADQDARLLLLVGRVMTRLRAC